MGTVHYIVSKMSNERSLEERIMEIMLERSDAFSQVSASGLWMHISLLQLHISSLPWGNGK